VVNFLLGGNFWEFLLGIISAWLSLNYHKKIKTSTASIAGLLFITLLVIIKIPYANPVSFFVYGSLSLFVVFFFTVFEKNNTINSQLARVFKILGDGSYAIYLFTSLVPILIKGRDNLSKIMMMAIIIFLSISFNQLIENNFLAFIRKKIHPK
jgi:peptidoglycan/LPS O-acetylase OafA/YrhL